MRYLLTAITLAAPGRALADTSAPDRVSLALSAEAFFAARSRWPSFTALSTNDKPAPAVNGLSYRPSGGAVAAGAGMRLAIATEHWFGTLVGGRLGALTSSPSYRYTLAAAAPPAIYMLEIPGVYGEVLLPGVGYAVYGDHWRGGVEVRSSLTSYGSPRATLSQGSLVQPVYVPGAGRFEVAIETHACLLVGRGAKSRDWFCAALSAPALATDPLRAFDGLTVSLRYEHVQR